MKMAGPSIAPSLILIQWLWLTSPRVTLTQIFRTFPQLSGKCQSLIQKEHGSPSPVIEAFSQNDRIPLGSTPGHPSNQGSFCTGLAAWWDYLPSTSSNSPYFENVTALRRRTKKNNSAVAHPSRYSSRQRLPLRTQAFTLTLCFDLAQHTALNWIFFFGWLLVGQALWLDLSTAQCLSLQHWWWRQYVPPKRWQTTKILHGETNQNMKSIDDDTRWCWWWWLQYLKILDVSFQKVITVKRTQAAEALSTSTSKQSTDSSVYHPEFTTGWRTTWVMDVMRHKLPVLVKLLLTQSLPARIPTYFSSCICKSDITATTVFALQSKTTVAML
jgi:hypothetical protein